MSDGDRRAGTSDYGALEKSSDFLGRGGTTERCDFGPSWPEVMEQSACRRGPKSPDSKFRETSSISPPSERLHQGADSSGFAARRDAARRDAKSAYRAERTGSRLEKAKQKQAKQRPPKKPGPIKSARRTVQSEARRAVHGKIYQAEQENVGIEAAHRTELAGESALRGTSRLIRQRIRTRPARNVRKWEKRDIKAKADVQFRKLAQKHPELKKSALSRLVQKQRVKRQVQKQARSTVKRGAQAAKKTAAAAGRFTAAVARFFTMRPLALLALGIVLLLIVTLQACMGLVASLGGGGAGGIGGAAASADAIYTSMEQALQLSIEQLEADNPGFDEYRRKLGPIGHDPAELLAFVSVFGELSEEELNSTLQAVFNRQYQLAGAEVTETRETVDADGKTVTRQVRVFEITLTVIPFSEAAAGQLTPEQLALFRQYINKEASA